MPTPARPPQRDEAEDYDEADSEMHHDELLCLQAGVRVLQA
jgi:hypothetical protein